MAAKTKPALSWMELDALAPAAVDEAMGRRIVAVYAGAKDLHVRNLCLRLLYDKRFEVLEGFFEQAFRKERHLDMRVRALRGLAQFRDENALVGPLAKISESLRKLAVNTPYAYQTYECILGKDALPYLVARYGYACLQEALTLAQANYDAMPEAFKGHFTIGEDGKPIALRSPEESKRILSDFWAAQSAP